jgi:ribosomal-protein-alanine N-acetyltransferase
VSSAWPEIETARLTLRLARPSMASSVAAFFAENWAGHLDRWSPQVGPGFFSEEYWRGRLERFDLEWQSGAAARFVLQPRGPAAGPVIGTCNYTNIVRGPFQACNLGYQVARSHQGQGLMAEALGELNAFVFRELRLHRIMANHIPENVRSAKLLQCLGFRREGVAKEYLFIAGAWRDHVLNALANPDFRDSWVEVPG